MLSNRNYDYQAIMKNDKFFYLKFLLSLIFLFGGNELLLGESDQMRNAQNSKIAYEEALLLSQKQDSLYIRNNTQWHEQQDSIFNLSDNEEKIIKYTHLIDHYNQLWFFTIGLLCLTIVFLVRYQQQKNKQKQLNIKLYDSIINKENTCEQLRNIEKEFCQLKAIVNPSPVVNMEEEENQLFSKIELLMEKQKLYLQSDLSQEQILNDLHISARALKCTLLAKTGLSFSEYILSLRLKYARKLLLESNQMSVEKIAYASGFNSRRTFYRVFQDNFGMSPLEYKQLSFKAIQEK